MFVKLAVLACTLALATAAWNGPLAGGVPAHQFPAGVSPQACPNYPNCNNPAVAAQPAAAHGGAWGGAQAGGWNGGANNGAWNNGGWNNGGNNGGWDNGGHNGGWNNGANGGYTPSNALDAGEYTGDGDYRGEGLAESGAYGNVDGGYDNGGYNNGAYNGGYNNGGYNNGAYNPAGHGGAAAVPAGVDPHSCPNYPFCH